MMRAAGDSLHGQRLRGLIAVLWRAGLRISEALALAESDLDARRGAVLVRRGKGGRRREVGMDDWAWQELQPWLTSRLELPVGPLFCIITGPTRGRRWSTAAARNEMRARRGRGRSPQALRAAPASPRARRRDGPRRRPADRHPAPARPQQPRHHLDLPPRHRQRRDHRHRPCPTRTHDPRTHHTLTPSRRRRTSREAAVAPPAPMTADLCPEQRSRPSPAHRPPRRARRRTRLSATGTRTDARHRASEAHLSLRSVHEGRRQRRQHCVHPLGSSPNVAVRAGEPSPAT